MFLPLCQNHKCICFFAFSSENLRDLKGRQHKQQCWRSAVKQCIFIFRIAKYSKEGMFAYVAQMLTRKTEKLFAAEKSKTRQN